MNELQIKTITLQPATIEFNKEQVINELKNLLAKYDNLVFTEDNTTDIRKTLAELRKGRKTADDYRKEIKKELTAPVTSFEKEMKEITALFDEVIDPINTQLKEYEERRKEEKRQEIQSYIDEVVTNLKLEPKFANQIEIIDSYLNKSASLSSTKDSIDFVASNLLNEQKLETMNKENIEQFVKLQNNEHNMNLSVVAYLSQLEFKDVEDVKTTIKNDVEAELKRLEQKRIEVERKAVIEAEKETEVIEEEPLPFEPVIEDFPFQDIQTTETVRFIVTTENENITKIRDFLSQNNIMWSEE